MKQRKIKIERKSISFYDLEKTEQHLLQPIGIKRFEKATLQVFICGNVSVMLKYKKPIEISNSNGNIYGICVDTTIDILTDIRNYPDDFILLEDLKIKLRKSNAFSLRKSFQGKVFVRKDSNKIIGSKIQMKSEKLKEIIGLNCMPNSIAGILVLLHEIGHSKTNNSEDTELQKERNAWAWALSTIKPFLFELKIKKENLNCFIHECCLASYSKKLTQS